MKKKITMPELKPNMEKGVLCEWKVKEGDTVKRGEPLFEVETDKVVTSVEAQEDIKIISLLAEEGDEIPAGDAVCEAEVI